MGPGVEYMTWPYLRAMRIILNIGVTEHCHSIICYIKAISQMTICCLLGEVFTEGKHFVRLLAAAIYPYEKMKNA